MGGTQLYREVSQYTVCRVIIVLLWLIVCFTRVKNHAACPSVCVCVFSYAVQHHQINHCMMMGVTIQWTGLLHWNTGLDYWTDIFLAFAHSMVGFTESC